MGARLPRQSNIELLRIIAMLMVIALHANFGVTGYPTPKPVNAEPLTWLGRIFSEEACIACVDTFVLITGWFGTHFKPRGAVRLLFQTFFFALTLSALLWLITGSMPDSWRNIVKSGVSYWFVYSYLLLYLLSPALNAWVERAGEREQRQVLVVFFIFSVPLSFFLNDLNRGYSAVWFMGLYLLGRYLRLFIAPRWAGVPQHRFATVWAVCVVGMTAAYWAHIYFRDPLLPYLPSFVTSYTNPLAVACAVCLLCFFDRLNFTSRAVNWLAAGSLAAYLTHQQIFVRPYFKEMFLWLNEQYDGLIFIVVWLSLIVIIFLLSAVIDYPVRLLWQGIVRRYDRLHSPEHSASASRHL